jgi:glutamate-1-semialdehyde 2,1-aminomutase
MIRNFVRTIQTIDHAILTEERKFLKRVPQSIAAHERACKSIPNGVGSNWANARPTPVWIQRGRGAYVWDLDGNRYIDFHGGYGSNLVGHAHPKIVNAVSKRVRLGTHFAQPVPDMTIVAENLAARFKLPKWRFCNSGTEVTMCAVQLMRAVTKRDLIVKIEGCYNGHHDTVNVSLFRSIGQLGPEDNPSRVPSNGVTQATADQVLIVPFNNLAALEAVYRANPGRIAGMILEPMMMNAGIINPAPGYLAGIREITARYGSLLTYDEVKTGLVVAPGGATELYGVKPDIVCLAKALGGGLPCGAIGGSETVMRAIETGEYNQVGTFNANPLTMAVSRVVLEEILTPEAYKKAEQLGTYILERALDLLWKQREPAYGIHEGFKVALVFNQEVPIKNYREFLGINTAESHLHFLKQFNGGLILPPWGKSESLTLSVAHTEKHADIYLRNLKRYITTVKTLKPRASTGSMFQVGGFDTEV